ncbi:MAG TPA: (2Fe-2S)-binding protein [Mycobacteriales bacterium]|nr:(2Fe-2S)-binding protein [Mycobacteriales bacterium]
MDIARPAEPVAISRALAGVARLGGYFAVRTGRPCPDEAGPPWRPGEELTGLALPGLVALVQDRIAGGGPRVAASLLFQGYAARLWSPVLAMLVMSGQVPDLRPAALAWRYPADGSLELRLPRPGGWAGPVDALVPLAYRAVVESTLTPFMLALRQTVSISERLLWGNAASALAGAARLLDYGRPGDLIGYPVVTRLLELDALRGTGTLVPGTSFQRRSCCLYYRVPGGGLCSDCVLTSRR